MKTIFTIVSALKTPFEVRETSRRGFRSGAAMLSIMVVAVLMMAGQYSAQAQLPATHWLGETSNAWNANNWASDAAGTVTSSTPTSSDDITFSANGAQNLSTVLGADFSIKSLTYLGNSPSVTIGNSTGQTHTLTIGSGGVSVLAGSASHTISAGVVLGASQTWTLDATAGDLNVSGGISGASGFNLTKLGGGTLNLTGTNTYLGQTLVGAGTLKVTGGGSITQTSLVGMDGAATDKATVTVDGTGGGASLTTTGFIAVGNSRVGAMNILNGGTVASSGQSFIGTMTGGTGVMTVDGAKSSWTQNGNLSVGWGGTGTLNITNGGQVSSATSYLGDLAGSDGTVLIDGAGSKWTTSGALFVANFSNGRITVSNGGTLISSDSFVGNQPHTIGTATVKGAGSVWNADFLTIGRDGTGTVTVQEGAVINVHGGTGTATLGLNSDGRGTLNIGAGGAAGTINAAAINGGAGGGVLNFNHSNINLAFAPIITGNVTVNHNGPGSTILSGTNTYTGNTTINGGTLYVDGSIASPNTFVNPGGTLGGNGIIHGNVINSGIVSPGHSPGLLTIGGNYTQTAGGTLVMQIASNTSFDKLAVGGHASLGGKLQIVALNGYQPQLGDHLVFLTAGGGVSGKFSTVDNPFLGSLVRLDVNYGANDVSLDASQNSFTNAFGITTTNKAKKAGAPAPEPTSVFGITPNQISTALALDSALLDGRQAKVLQYLDGLPFAAVPHQLDRIAPEELTSIYTLAFAQMDAEVLTVQQRLADIRAASHHPTEPSVAPLTHDGKGMVMDKQSPSVQTPTQDQYGFFLTETGDFASAGDTYNSNGFNIKTAGTSLGFDVALSDHFVLGLLLGYARTQSDLIDNGSLRVDGGRAALYAMYHKGGFFAEGMAGGGYNSYDIARSALQGTAFSRPDGGEFDGYYGVGYDIKAGRTTFTPIASVLYTLVGINGTDETGSLQPLHLNSQNESSLRSRFGLRASRSDQIRTVTMTSSLSAEWQHEFLQDELPFQASFANGAGDLFTVHGPNVGRDSALLTAAVNFTWSRYAAYIAYQADLGRTNYENQTVLVGFRVSW